MNKKPFTNKGLQELLTELYQLPDVALQIEADTLAADLRKWLENNFLLSAEQLIYIAGIDNRQIANTAADGQYFVSKRLPITLIKMEKPASYAGDAEGKLFDLSKQAESSYSPQAGYSKVESLTITISYT